MRNAEDVVRAFVAHIPGCLFARTLAKQPNGMLWQTYFAAPDAAIVGDVETFLRKGADAKKVCGLVFPAVRSPNDVCALLKLLCGDARWTHTEPRWKRDERDAVLVSLRWKTLAEHKSSVMGLAPFDTMPVHRRAPYVALIVWPGGKDNPWHVSDSKNVSFLDVALPREYHEDEAAYDQAYAQSKEESETFRANPPEGAARPDVTFCLPSSCRASLFT